MCSICPSGLQDWLGTCLCRGLKCETVCPPSAHSSSSSFCISREELLASLLQSCKVQFSCHRFCWYHVLKHSFDSTCLCEYLQASSSDLRGFPDGSKVKNPPANAGDSVQSLGQEYLQEKEMATHSSVLVWEISWIERSLVGYTPWCCKESDPTEWLNTHARLLILSSRRAEARPGSTSRGVSRATPVLTSIAGCQTNRLSVPTLKGAAFFFSPPFSAFRWRKCKLEGAMNLNFPYEIVWNGLRLWWL